MVCGLIIKSLSEDKILKLAEAMTDTFPLLYKPKGTYAERKTTAFTSKDFMNLAYEELVDNEGQFSEAIYRIYEAISYCLNTVQKESMELISRHLVLVKEALISSKPDLDALIAQYSTQFATEV